MPRQENWWDVYEAPDRRFDKEKPIVGRTWLLESSSQYQPETDLEALMMTAPGDIPLVSKEHQREEAEWLIDIMESVLTPKELAVAEVCLMAGHSIRQAASILGMRKSTVADYKRRAIQKIQQKVEEHYAAIRSEQE